MNRFEAFPNIQLAKGLPFDLRPSAETLEAMREVEDMKKQPENYQGYNNARAMFDDILGEEN